MCHNDRLTDDAKVGGDMTSTSQSDPDDDNSQNSGKGRRLTEHHPSEPERGESSHTEEGSSWGQGVPPCARPRGVLPVPTGAGVPSGQTLQFTVLSGSTILRSARQLDNQALLPSTGQPATRRHTACGGILQYNNNNMQRWHGRGEMQGEGETEKE